MNKNKLKHFMVILLFSLTLVNAPSGNAAESIRPARMGIFVSMMGDPTFSILGAGPLVEFLGFLRLEGQVSLGNLMGGLIGETVFTRGAAAKVRIPKLSISPVAGLGYSWSTVDNTWNDNTRMDRYQTFSGGVEFRPGAGRFFFDLTLLYVKRLSEKPQHEHFISRKSEGSTFDYNLPVFPSIQAGFLF